MPDLSDLTDQLLRAAKAAGAESADAMAVHGTSIELDVRKGLLEQVERSEATDLGLRVLIGGRQACISASDTRPDTLRELAERAVAMARAAPEDPHAGLAPEGLLATRWDIAALDLVDDASEPDPAALEEVARTAEAAAAEQPGVTQVDSAAAAYTRRSLHLATSTGFSGGYTRTDHMRACTAISGHGTGMERDYDYDGRRHMADLRGAAEIGKLAGERAAARQGARRPATGTYPVLFDERAASSLIGHLLMAINGQAVARGTSWLRDAIGERVLPEGMDLIEEPLRPRAAASRPFDGEGLATGDRALVADGVLQGYVLDLATGRKLGMESTANAQRGTSAPPSPGVSNLRVTQGSASRGELMADMGTGLLVTSMIGSTINPNTGDYSRGANGFWIEGGEIAYPVSEVTIAGNLRDMLGALIPANDARAHLSRVVPSLLVPSMVLAGS